MRVPHCFWVLSIRSWQAMLDCRDKSLHFIRSTLKAAMVAVAVGGGGGGSGGDGASVPGSDTTRPIAAAAASFTMATCKEVSCVIPPDFGTVMFPVIYSIVFIVGIMGNVVAAFLVRLYVKQKNVLGVYLLNLCISDVLYLATLPVWIAYTSNEESWTYGEGACKAVGFFFYTNNYSTIIFLSCIALDRFLAVVYPLHSLGLRRMRTAWGVCAVVWILMLVTNLPLLLHPQLFKDSHSRSLCYERYPMERWVAQLSYFRVFVAFLLPFVITVGCYGYIIRTVHRCASVERRRKRKIICLVVVIITIFVVSFLPYHVLLLVRAIASDVTEGCSCDFEIKVRKAYRVAFALTCLNSALDPILNIFVSENFREDLRKAVAPLRACLRAASCGRWPQEPLRRQSATTGTGTVRNSRVPLFKTSLNQGSATTTVL
ncbi:G-protein coupled receptor 4-like isoform X1 [Lethenteron reissneri]|uniref:G-protein coupled receptor 4-like isoform X1 n=2 Tax=Lethenteron reissneri TaxID=7753 RepID=UPI002AB7A568|nr:G-protein coupled receptor 4-like isoform X1 [Lethenteron reissneri]